MTELTEQFLSQFRIARYTRLMILDVRFDRALKDDNTEALMEIRAERRMLLDFPETVIDGTREELIAQWPKGLPGLPEWFIDPPIIEETAHLVVDCSQSLI